jgi:hypothetical protein
MIRLPDDFYRALAQARKAVHRGDIAAAKEWTSLVERHIRIAERHEALTMARSTQPATRKTPKPKDPTEQPGYVNPWVWPKHWTPERIAEAERRLAEERRRKAAQKAAQPESRNGEP